MNKVVLKQLIDDAIKFEFHRSFDYEGSILFDNLSLIDIHNNYKWFSEKHSLNNEEKAFFILELIKHYQFGSFLYNIDENLQNKIIEMFNAELNDLNQNEDVKLKNDAKEKLTQITPIWWISTDRELGYLIEQLEKNKLIDIGGNINKVIKEHFTKKTKEPFSDSIKQNRSGTTKPKGHKNIDEIINKIKPKKD